MKSPLTKPQKATLLKILRRESHVTHLIEVGIDREDFVELHRSTIERLMAEAFLAGVEEARGRLEGRDVTAQRPFADQRRPKR